MKKFILPAVLGLTITFTACDGGSSEEDGEDGNDTDVAVVDPGVIDLKGLREFDMSPYDLNVIIYIPEAYKFDQEEQVDKYVQPVIVHNDGEALWDITMPNDKHFHMVIEDWGDIAQTVADEKKLHLDQGDIYDYVYETEGDDHLLFVRKLKDDNSTLETDVSKLPMHHFFTVKQIDGYYIVARSYGMQDYHMVTAKKMMNCARSMKSAI